MLRSFLDHLCNSYRLPKSHRTVNSIVFIVLIGLLDPTSARAQGVHGSSNGSRIVRGTADPGQNETLSGAYIIVHKSEPLAQVAARLASVNTADPLQAQQAAQAFAMAKAAIASEQAQ